MIFHIIAAIIGNYSLGGSFGCGLAGFLAGCAGLTREAYALGPRSMLMEIAPSAAGQRILAGSRWSAACRVPAAKP